MPPSGTNDALGLPPERKLPTRPDAAARRGTSAGRRNASAGNGCGNGGSPAPWNYRRRISELGAPEPRNKHYRHQFRRAVGHLAYTSGLLRPIDVNVADVLLDLTHGGTRDFRTTEAHIAALLPSKSSGEAVSKRVASDALDRLRTAGLVDWDHGTTDDFYDETRRALLDGRWQGPPTYRLLIPRHLHGEIIESEAEARSRTWRTKNQTSRRRGHAHDEGPSRREVERRQAQSNAAALARAASTTTSDDGLAALERAYGDDPELLAAAREQFRRSWMPRGPT